MFSVLLNVMSKMHASVVEKTLPEVHVQHAVCGDLSALPGPGERLCHGKQHVN